MQFMHIMVGRSAKRGLSLLALSKGQLEKSFLSICERVWSCTACERMSASARILSEASGRLDAEIMFVGEAPGRLGADRSAIPFHGDAAGHNFERLLNDAGLDRNNVFVTNAVLCNPRDEHGNNATPNGAEIENCAGFLREQINLVNPRVIATLGQRALLAASKIECHSLSLATEVATLCPWYGRLLMPLYHPGARALIHRPYAVQLEDYKKLAAHLQTVTCEMAPLELAAAILHAAERPLSYFALHKLYYIVEVKFAKLHGKRLTKAYIIRQAEGPYVTDLHLRKLQRAFPQLRTFNRTGKLYLSLDKTLELALFAERANAKSIDDEFPLSILRPYITKSDAQLKTIAYLTGPMRCILATEKRLGLRLNRPIPIL
jgi:uracil-DNA glycosylase family 4